MAPDATTRVVNGARVSTIRPLASQAMSLTAASAPAPRPETMRPICGPPGVWTYSSITTLPAQSMTPQSAPSGTATKPGSVFVAQLFCPP